LKFRSNFVIFFYRLVVKGREDLLIMSLLIKFVVNYVVFNVDNLIIKVMSRQ